MNLDEFMNLKAISIGYGEFDDFIDNHPREKIGTLMKLWSIEYFREYKKPIF